MEDLEKQQKANFELIGRLLRTSFNGAQISACKIPTDGRKFKIVHDGRKMFLCVSLEYLSDQREERIQRHFKDLNVQNVLLRSLDQPLLLSNESVHKGGLELISAANAKCSSKYEEAPILWPQ
jgi:hypothetical protein